MKNQKETSWAEIRALVKENAQSIKETRKEFDRLMKESKKEFDQEMKESRKEMKESSKEFDKRIKETERLIKENAKQIGGITASNGEFCEEYFVNCFKENRTFLGEKFDRVVDNLKPEPMIVNDQYDLVLRNGKTIVLIEMKYKAKVSDVKGMFLKLKSYRANYPMFNDYKVYLCLASFSFRDYIKLRAAKEGIVLVQQRGEKIEVVSENLRAW